MYQKRISYVIFIVLILNISPNTYASTAWSETGDLGTEILLHESIENGTYLQDWFQENSLNFNISGSNNGTLELFEKKTTNLNLSSKTDSIHLDFQNGYVDLLDYYGQYYPYVLDNSSGSLYDAVSMYQNIFSIVKNDTQYQDSLRINYQIPIVGNEEIVIGLETHPQWDLVEGVDNGFSFIAFKFDTVTINFLLKCTDSMLPLFENNTGSVTITSYNTSEIRLPLNKLLNASEISSLNSISFNGYSTKIYNYSIEVKSLHLLSPTSSVSFNIDDKEYTDIDNLTIPIESQVLLNLSLSSKYFANLLWEQTFEQTIEAMGTNYFDGNDLFVNMSILESLHFSSQKYKITFPSNFIQKTVDIRGSTNIYQDTSGYEFSQESNSLQANISLKYNAHTNSTSFSDMVQGSTYVSNINHKDHMGSFMFNGKNQEIVDAIKLGEYYHYPIPNYWEKGEVTIMLFREDGILEKYFGNLLLSPTRLKSNTTVLVHPAKSLNYPIEFVNITSGESHLAEKIVSYYDNGTFRSFDSHQLAILTGEFSNDIILTINATKEGFVPLHFDLALKIQSFDPSIELSGKRISGNKAEISLSIEDLSTWTVSANLVINNSDFNLEKSLFLDLTKVELEDNSWTNDDEINLQVYLILGENWIVKTANVTIGRYHEDELSPTGIIATSGVISGLFFTVIRFGKKYLNRNKMMF